MPIDYRTDRRYRHLSEAQVRQHFEIERELRHSLLNSSRDNRSEVFTWAYDELFRQVPWHPALTEPSGMKNSDLIAMRVQQIGQFLPKTTGATVLEVGCGMGELMIGLSNEGFSCTGIDVSEVRIQGLKSLEHDHLRFQVSEATSLPFDASSFDAVISMQLFEHLHPDDALLHLSEVRRVLKPGGRYLLETPNKWIGPGDISRFFSDAPLGFHLQEYSVRDLCHLFGQADFTSVTVILRKSRTISSLAAQVIEGVWRLLPKAFRLKHTFGLHNPLYIAYK